MYRESENRTSRQIYRLNYFYAFTVFLMTVIALTLLFTLNREQREVINDLAQLVQTNSYDADQRNARAEERLDRSMERISEMEDDILENMDDKFTDLEVSILDRLQEN